MEHWQSELLAGSLPERHGTVILDDPDAMVDGRAFAHYVTEVTLLSHIANACAHAPVIVETTRRLLGPQVSSGYSRIGWHSDWQSGPHLDIWPSVAFTIHLDATSPANGFLRVVPGSHLGGTEGMPPGFEKVPGEIALYCDVGDVLLHDARLWHAAARATDDPPLGVRRHVRGSWHGGTRLPAGHGVDDFIKNAKR